MEGDAGVDAAAPEMPDAMVPESRLEATPARVDLFVVLTGEELQASETVQVSYSGSMETPRVAYDGLVADWLDVQPGTDDGGTATYELKANAEGLLEGVYRAYATFAVTDDVTGQTLSQDVAVYLSVLASEEPPTIPAFDPDETVIGADGVIYMLSREHTAIFRRSSLNGLSLTPIDIGADPGEMAYDAAEHRLYVSHAPDAITRIDLAEGVGEAPFASVAATPHGLAVADSIVLVADSSGAWNTHHTFLPSGEAVDSVEWNRYSRAYEWSPTNQRMYFFRDGTSPNDLHYEEIDTETGEILSSGETPYHGSYSIQPPIRASLDGAFVLLGSGDIYDGSSLEIVQSLPVEIADAIWLGDNNLVTLRGEGQTVIEQWDSELRKVNQVYVPGAPRRALRGLGDDLVVMTHDGTAPVFHAYVLTDDGDGDGVPFADDAFPLDPAASVDTDGDGYPDAWNPGMSEADSTTGLVLDAFPEDAACQLPSHSLPDQPDVCDIANGIPDYTPDAVVAGDGVIYLFSAANRAVYRWSLASDYHLNPIYLAGDDPRRVAYSGADERLYIAYGSGEITKIELASGVAEEHFATLPSVVHGLATAGSVVLAADASGSWNTHYTFLADGTAVEAIDWNYYSQYYEWSASNGRMYFFRDGSPSDLHYEEIDTATGAITGSGESPYHGAYSITGPIRASRDGQYVLLGSGDLYDGISLEVVDSLPISPADAAWLADGALVTLRADGSETRLEQWDPTLRLVNYQNLVGAPIRVLRTAGEVMVVTMDSGQPAFHAYVPTDDGDGDGVPFADDAFPLDPAASVDTDGDGYPDAWNPGMSEADSTTGLVLDAFPEDSACQLPSHSLPDQPDECDIANGIPDYTPDAVVAGDGVIYLFSATNRAVYRWSLASDYHLNPIYLAGDDPRRVAYSGADERLYIAYGSGEITRIELASGVAEEHFATLPSAVHGLATAGSVVLAADSSGAWNTHYTFLADGTAVEAIDWNRSSRYYEWSASNGRMYFFRDGSSPNDLHYEEIDTATGAITGSGESPYHGSYSIIGPIRASHDGQYVLLGSGDLYDGISLEVVGSLSISPEDAAWLADGSLLTIRSSGTGTVVEEWNSAFQLIDSQSFPGAPLRVLETASGAMLITHDGSQPVFTPLL